MSKRPWKRRSGTSRRRTEARPHLESMERRELLATFTVVNNSSGGAGSLFEAITLANRSPGGDTIEFNLPIGSRTITGALPEITDTIQIDALDDLNPRLPTVELDGDGGGGTGLVLTTGSVRESDDSIRLTSSSGSSIRGLAINNFNGNGISIFTSDNIIDGNYIGLGLDGVTDRGNGRHGIYISDERVQTLTSLGDGASRNRIGTETIGNQIKNNGKLGPGFNGITVLDQIDLINPLVPIRNEFLNNGITANSGIGIDLGDDGPTANDGRGDPDVGENMLQNKPRIISAVTTRRGGVNSMTIVAELDTVDLATYRIGFFHSNDPGSRFTVQGETALVSGFYTDNREGQDSAPGEGLLRLTYTTPDQSVIRTSGFITMTATDAERNTSEFSDEMAIEFDTDEVDIRVDAFFAGAGDSITAKAGDPLTFVATISHFNTNAESADAVLTTFLPPGFTSEVFANELLINTGDPRPSITTDRTSGQIRVDFGPLPRATRGPFGFIIPASRTIRFTAQAAEAGYLSARFFAESGGVSDPDLSNDAATVVANVNLDPSTAIIEFESAEFTAQESGPAAVITVRRSNALGSTIEVPYSTQDGTAVAGTDYQARSGRLTFAPSVETMTFLVPLIDDGDFGPNRTVRLVLGTPEDLDNENPPGSVASVILGPQSGSTLTIFDDDPETPVTQVLSLSPSYTVDENAGRATIRVRRTGSTTGTVSVRYATVDGTATAGVEYTSTSGTLTFNDGEEFQSFTVRVADDTVLDGDKAFRVQLSNGNGAAVGDPSSAPVTIVDDESPPAGTFQFAAPTYQVTENQMTAFITVTREGGTGAATIRYATTPGTAVADVRYRPVSGTLQFAAGETSKVFEVEVVNTTEFEGTQTVGLALQVEGEAVLGTPGTAVLSIFDDEAPPPAVIQFASPTYQVQESGGSITVTLSRVGNIEQPVAVLLTTTGGTATSGQDFLPVSTTVFFAAGEFVANVDIPIVNDGEIESIESFSVTISAPSAGAILGPQATAVVSIVSEDADFTPPRVTDLDLGATGRALTSVFLSVSEALSPASVADLSHYSVVAFGRDGRPGTADDRVIPIASAGFDAATNRVVLALGAPVPNGQFAALSVGGLLDTSGNVLDGDADGLPGGIYSATFGRSTTLRYRDADGDRVTLRLRNGGILQLTRDARGEGQVLKLVNPVLNRSVLTGSVQRRAAGTTSFRRIEGLDPFGRIRTTLKTPPFFADEVTGLTGGLAAARNGRRVRRG